MLKTKKQKLTIVIFLIAICCLLIYSYIKTDNQKIKEPNINQEEKTTEIATLEINGIKYESEISEEISVYDFMIKMQNEGKVIFKEKTYPGMGKFIEEINGTKGDGENFWIYYINGKKAEIGISEYKIKPNDIITWKYESYN
jgi:hypothetical protein